MDQKNENQSPFQESIDDINRTKEKLEEAAENSEDVKNRTSTPEKEKQEPGYIIYNAIMNTTVKILQSQTMVEVFDKFAKQFGPEMSKELITALSLAMTHSSYNAIVLYDEMLKKEIQKAFDIQSDAINKIAASVNGHQGALEIYKKRLEDVERAIRKIQ